MTPPDEPMAPPSQYSLIKRCKKSRYQPRQMFLQAQKILSTQADNVDALEYARRILHVLLQGGCVKPFTKLQRQAAYTLTKWRMYAHRFKKAFPYRKRPPFPPCKLKK